MNVEHVKNMYNVDDEREIITFQNDVLDIKLAFARNLHTRYKLNYNTKCIKYYVIIFNIIRLSKRETSFLNYRHYINEKII